MQSLTVDHGCAEQIQFYSAQYVGVGEGGGKGDGVHVNCSNNSSETSGMVTVFYHILDRAKLRSTART